MWDHLQLYLQRFAIHLLPTPCLNMTAAVGLVQAGNEKDITDPR